MPPLRVTSRRHVTRARNPLPEGKFSPENCALVPVSKTSIASFQFGENYAQTEASKADGQELACDFCDGWPTFETEEEFSRHYFQDHLRQKMEEHMDYLTDFKAVLYVRKILHINLEGRMDDADRAHAPGPELAIERPKRQSQSRRWDNLANMIVIEK